MTLYRPAMVFATSLLLLSCQTLVAGRSELQIAGPIGELRAEDPDLRREVTVLRERLAAQRAGQNEGEIIEHYPNAMNGGSREITSPEHGIYYLEIVTPDVEVARDLYSDVHGWRFGDMASELGNAFVASLPGGSLCGIRAPMHDQEERIVRTYVRVTDIDQSIQRAADLGGTVALEPMEIAGRGKIAIYLLGGIQQGIWQVE